MAGLAVEPFKDFTSAYNQSTRELLKTAVKDGHPAKINGTKKAVEGGLKAGRLVRLAGRIIVVGGIVADAGYGAYHLSNGNNSDAYGSFAMSGAGVLAAATGPAGLIWYGMLLMEPTGPPVINTPMAPVIHPSDNTRYVVPSKLIGN